MSGVVPRSVSFAFGSAPWSSKTFIASILPVRAAIISGVRPSGSFSLTSAPPSMRAARIDASPSTLASHIGAGADQDLDELPVAMKHGPVQRRGAVGLGGVDVGLLRQEFLDGGFVASHGRVGDVGPR